MEIINDGKTIKTHIPLLANGAYPILARLLDDCDAKTALSVITENMHKCFVLHKADYDPETRKLQLLFRPGNGCQTVLLPLPMQEGGDA